MITLYPKGKDRIDAVRLRLKRVGIEGGEVVEYVELVQPSQIMEHEAGTKPYDVPRAQIVVDGMTLMLKRLPRTIECPVVMQIVDAHFKPFLLQGGSERVGNPVLALRHKVE
jgi:hypothetical protein